MDKWIMYLIIAGIAHIPVWIIVDRLQAFCSDKSGWILISAVTCWCVALCLCVFVVFQIHGGA